MEEPRVKLKEILQFLRISLKDVRKTNTEINDIYLQLDKCYSHTDHNDWNRNIITKVVEVFTKVKCSSCHLVACLAKVFSSDDFKCLEVREVISLLHWLKNYMQINKAYDICGTMLILVNILKADVHHSRSILQIIIDPHHAGILRQLKDNNFENILAITQCLDLILSANDVEYQYTKQQVDFYVVAGVTILEQHYQNQQTLMSCDLWSVFLLSSVSLLTKICNLTAEFPKNYISELLGFIKAYWQYGLKTNSQENYNITKVTPSQQALYHLEDDSDKAENTGGKVNKQRKPRAVIKGKRQNIVNQTHFPIDKLNDLILSIDLKTSESDSSETEVVSNREAYRKRQIFSKVRLNVILLLGCVARAQPRSVIYRYWHAFFPHDVIDAQDHILFIAQNDMNIRCRSAALQITAQLLFESKQFLKLAECQRKPTSYLSFSANLALTVLKIYDNLLYVLKNEAFLAVLIQGLKCLAVLVQASSFEQLENGILQRVAEQVRPFLYHRDSTIQVSALMVFEFLILDQKLLPELALAIGLPEKSVTNQAMENISELNLTDEEAEFELGTESDNEDLETSNTQEQRIVIEHKPLPTPSFWLLKHVIRKLLYNKERLVSLSVRIECLQLLFAFSAHFALFINLLEKIADCLLLCLKDSQQEIRLHAARCADTLAYHISSSLAATVNDNSTIASNSQQECHKFWSILLPALQNAVCDNCTEVAAVKVHILDAISNIGECIFEKQPHAAKMNLVIFLTGVGSDNSEDALVRAAAVRALAVFTQFPTLRDDFVFIENAIDMALRLCSDGNQFVRVKAIWSLGNISDALVTHAIKNNTDTERISEELFCRLLRICTETCSDSDKVRCNAVRTVGNLVRITTHQQFLLEPHSSLCKNAIEKLIECIRTARNAKVKWNACYAISNLIRNEDLFLATTTMPEPNWQNSLYPLLCNTIVQHPNFKVRISATAVISNIQKRAHFGNYFESFWSVVLQAIEQTFHLDNYYEYNHRDQLQEQLCLALSHLVNCANCTDMPMMHKELTARVKVVQNTWERVLSRMVPEKVAPLLLCMETLSARLKDNCEAVQLNAIQFIIDVFKQNNN